MITIHKNHLVVAMFLLVLGSTAAYCAETTSARKFQEIIKTINSDVNTVRNDLSKAQVAHARRIVKNPKPEEQVRIRRKAIQALRKSRAAFKENPSKDNEAELRQAINNYVKSSNDTYENLKNRVIYDQKRVEIVTKGLAGIINKMRRLEKLSENMNANTAELKKIKLETQRQIKSSLQIVDNLAKTGHFAKGGSARLKRALAMQWNHINRMDRRWGRAFKNIGKAREKYEHVFGELQIVRRELESEKTFLISLIDNDIARSLLLKLSGAFIAGGSMNDIATNMLAICHARTGIHDQIVEDDRLLDGDTEDEFEILDSQSENTLDTIRNSTG